MAYAHPLAKTAAGRRVPIELGQVKPRRDDPDQLEIAALSSASHGRRDVCAGSIGTQHCGDLVVGTSLAVDGLIEAFGLEATPATHSVKGQVVDHCPYPRPSRAIR